MSKISDDLFLDISQNFPANYLPKILTTVFRHFSQFLLFLSLFFLNIFPDAPLSWMPVAVLHFLRIYPYFFGIYLCIFFLKTPSLDVKIIIVPPTLEYQ